jgi:hypothetical protein
MFVALSRQKRAKKEKVIILAEHQRKCAFFKRHNFRTTSRSDRQLQRKQMLLPDMFDSSGGLPEKYCHTGTGPSARTYHNPSGLKDKRPRQLKYLICWAEHPWFQKIFESHINADPGTGCVAT